MSTVSLSNICFSYKNKKIKTTALRNIDFSADAGTAVALMGVSGSGKSTLLNIISLLRRPDDGCVCLLEQDCTYFSDAKASKFRGKHIGYVLQQFGLIEDESVYFNIGAALRINGCSGKQSAKRTDELLKKFGMEDYSKKKVEDLSGGEKQRIAIIRALANDPEIILADEPTGSLDSENAMKITDMLVDLAHREKKCVIIVTHDKTVAEKTDRIYQMKDGMIIEE